MNILIASDIFGETASHLELCERFSKYHSVTSISPYQQKPPLFASESDAYHYFLKEGGMGNYLSRFNYLECANEIEVVLGFSAGGAAIWAIQEILTALSQGVAFYPGQIRHYLETNIICPWQIVFAKFEHHFDQEDVLNMLVKNKNLSLYRAPFEHGFINPQSENFDVIGRDNALNCFLNFKATDKTAKLEAEFAKYYEKFGNPIVSD
ncbi:dienelactone hydrolase family protein [Pseudoalteromonas sp.]|uniref:dienelactone hydrolase family protein n=1 Tax=Pseudoalteromonas sp. TaxID=53249 RepID=UPI00356AE551